MKRLPSQIGFQCFPRKFKLLRGLAQAVMKRVRNLTYVGAVCAFVYLSHSVWQEPLVLTGWLAYSSPPVVLRAFVYLCLGTVSYLPLNPVFVRLGCCSKIPQAGWLKPQKFASCQFWRLEVWDWGVSRSDFFWGLFLCPHMDFPVVYLCPHLLIFKGISHIGLGCGIILNGLILTSLSLSRCSLQIQSYSEVLGGRASTMSYFSTTSWE